MLLLLLNSLPLHDYFNFNTDVEIIWQAVQEDIPQLKMMISEVLMEIKN
ncbi:hypothetical protein [Coleofasciculus sp.]